MVCHWPSLGRRLFLAIVAATGIGLVPTAATAATYWETVKKNLVVVIDTSLGNLTAEQEVDKINANWEEWYRQREAAGQTSVGQSAIDGLYPIAGYDLTDLGTMESLTYFFIDPATGLRTTPAFAVSSVRSH